MFIFSDTPQTIKVFNFNAATNEYIGASDCHIPAHTGLPAYCTTQKPPVTKQGHQVIFDGEKWQITQDFRGAVAYDHKSGNSFIVRDIGPLHTGTTLVAPASEFDVWDGKKWVKDNKAEKDALIVKAQQTKKQQMKLAAENIHMLTFAKESQQATEDELSLLDIWQNYRLQLSRTDVSTAPEIDWPAKPANVA
ncbi:MAG: tail fiber assembly protein [Rouxiella badensis]|uniref:tail fiber assembly protein n=1 Tax=Rouxiella badensis TaxID=1646377 RepID=UPI003C31AD49